MAPKHDVTKKQRETESIASKVRGMSKAELITEMGKVSGRNDRLAGQNKRLRAKLAAAEKLAAARLHRAPLGADLTDGVISAKEARALL